MHQAFPKILCPNCGARLAVTSYEPAIACSCGALFRLDQNILFLSKPEDLEQIPEAVARNREAGIYLQLPKFPTQIASLGRFVAALPPPLAAFPALDLGCGPGPTTGMLLDKGYRVVAVDFSAASLRINAMANARHRSHVMYVAANLNDLRVPKAKYGVLMMADFLQHLGSSEAQCRFVNNIMPALVPGGMFYLSCLNYNIKNMLKNDRIGSFRGGAMPGAIRYRRSRVTEIVAMLPNEIEILSVRPMNVFHGAAADRLATKLPFSFLLARMIVVIGRRRAA
jgi:2-polyprenyl-3-methyl-5-hydroxy-6-metoxy-1,4-benzoquinol methylase